MGERDVSCRRCGTLYDVSWLSPKQQETAKFVVESRNERGIAISSGPPRTIDGPDNDMDTSEPTDGTEPPNIAKSLFSQEDDLATKKAKILQNIDSRKAHIASCRQFECDGSAAIVQRQEGAIAELNAYMCALEPQQQPTETNNSQTTCFSDQFNKKLAERKAATKQKERLIKSRDDQARKLADMDGHVKQISQLEEKLEAVLAELSRKITEEKVGLPIPEAASVEDDETQSQLERALESQRAELMRLFQEHDNARQTEAQAREQALQKQLQELANEQNAFQVPTVETTPGIDFGAIDAASLSKVKGIASKFQKSKKTKTQLSKEITDAKAKAADAAAAALPP